MREDVLYSRLYVYELYAGNEMVCLVSFDIFGQLSSTSNKWRKDGRFDIPRRCYPIFCQIYWQ